LSVHVFVLLEFSTYMYICYLYLNRGW